MQPPFALSLAAKILRALVGVGLISCTLFAQETTAPSKQSNLSPEAWRKTMLRIPHPKPQGCFVATHPTLAWKEVACTTAPERPYPPVRWPRPNVVGNGTDFSAQATGTLASAEGSFDSLAGITSETGNGGAANNWALQLNANFFTTTACNGASVPANCLGWQQFIYSNAGVVFMQYWLINFVNACPAGWNTFSGSCFRNSTAVASPVQPLSNLGKLTLTGTAALGGTDTVVFSTGTNLFSTSGNDNVVNLASGWNTSEYNIFGDCCASQANFNAGAHIIVRTSVNNGTMNAPAAITQGFTGETNNFTLVPPACPYGGAAPAIVFDESTNTNPSSMCANGTSIGDTHLTNINGLYYDFQATGDFLLAQTDSDFVVQTRQVSGAPSWPNASVNKAVAMRLGPTRLAVCLNPDRFIMDGKPFELRDGGSLSFLGGHVMRSGNRYVFTRPSGESVAVDVNNGWLNATIALGQLPVAWVHGLLGNANGDTEPNELAARDGSVLHNPVAFVDLYNHYGNSWRVPLEDSLPAQLCGGRDFERGNPSTTFFANNLNQADFNRARAICTAAGVKDRTLLDACTLDVTVLGDETAAKSFVHLPPPHSVVKPGKCQCEDDEEREEKEKEAR